MTNETVGLMFGALAEPIGKQLAEQGQPVNRARARAFQDIADAITLLKIHSYMADKAAERARKKLLKRVIEVTQR